MSTQTNLSEYLSYLEEVYDTDVISDYRKVLAGESDLTTQQYTHFNLVQAILDEMISFGSDTWWKSNEPKVIAWYSLFETDKRFVSFKKLITSIEKVLGRTVFSFELRYGLEGKLRAEVEQKLIFSVFDSC